MREASGQRGEQGSGSAVWRHIPSGASVSGTPRPFFNLLPSWTTSAGRDILVPVDKAQLLLQLPGSLWSSQLCRPTLLWPQHLGGIREGDLGHCTATAGAELIFLRVWVALGDVQGRGLWPGREWAGLGQHLSFQGREGQERGTPGPCLEPTEAAQGYSLQQWLSSEAEEGI